MRLYAYYRSSTSYRVRIALNLKGLSYETIAVDLLHGAQKTSDYGRINPFQKLPVLEFDGRRITQSLAIIDMLETRFADPSFFPVDPQQNLLVREWATMLATDIHALNNQSTLNYLKENLSATDAQVTAWIHYWIDKSFAPLEAKLAELTYQDLPFAQPTLFEIVLIPQIYNAVRFKLDMSAYPRLKEIYEIARKNPAFAAAAPERQVDFKTEF